MPFRHYLPDGSSFVVNDNVSVEQADVMARDKYPHLYEVSQPAAEEESGQGWISDTVIDPIKQSIYNSYAQAQTSAEILKAASNATPEQMADEKYLNDIQAAAKKRAEYAQSINPIQHSFRDAANKFSNEGISAGIGAAVDAAAESASGSLGYMAAPLLAGAATSAVASPLAGAGVSASLIAMQHAGENFQSWLEKDKSLNEFDKSKFALATAGQTALDVGMLAATGLVGRTLGATGEHAAKSAVLSGVGKAVEKMRALPTGTRVIANSLGEGSTEAFQLSLERWQAGDPMAPQDIDQMWEYAENFLGGAAGGALFETMGTAIDYRGKKRDERAEIESINMAKSRAKRMQDTAAVERLEEDKQRYIDEVNAMHEDALTGQREAEMVRVRPEDIHVLANERNIRWDGDPGFMRFVERVTRVEAVKGNKKKGIPAVKAKEGKLHLDELDNEQLRKVYRIVRNLPVREKPLSFYRFKEQEYYNLFKKLQEKKKGTKKGPKAISKSLLKEALNLNDPSFEDNYVEDLMQAAVTGMRDRGLIKQHGTHYVLDETKEQIDANVSKMLDLVGKVGHFPSYGEWRASTKNRSQEEYNRIRRFLVNSNRLKKPKPGSTEYLPTFEEREDSFGRQYSIKPIKQFTIRDTTGNIVKAFDTEQQVKSYIDYETRRVAHLSSDKNASPTSIQPPINANIGLTVSKQKENVYRLREKKLRQNGTVAKAKDIGWFEDQQKAEVSRDELINRRLGNDSISGGLVKLDKPFRTKLEEARASSVPEAYLANKATEERRTEQAAKKVVDPRQKTLEDIGAYLNQELKDRGLSKHGVGLKLVLKNADINGALAMFGVDHIVRLSVEHIAPNATFEEALASVYGDFNHETVHASRALGLITKAEWESLVRDSKKRMVTDKAGNKVSYYDHVKGLYQQAANVDTSGWIEDDFAEEAVAKMFGDYTTERLLKKAPKSKKITGQPAGIFKRLVEILRSFGKSFRSQGFQNSADIFSMLESGGTKDRKLANDIWYGKRIGEQKALLDDYKKANAGRSAIIALHASRIKFDSYKLEEGTEYSGTGGMREGWGIYHASGKGPHNYYLELFNRVRDYDNSLPINFGEDQYLTKNIKSYDYISEKNKEALDYYFSMQEGGSEDFIFNLPYVISNFIDQNSKDILFGSIDYDSEENKDSLNLDYDNIFQAVVNDLLGTIYKSKATKIINRHLRKLDEVGQENSLGIINNTINNLNTDLKDFNKYIDDEAVNDLVSDIYSGVSSIIVTIEEKLQYELMDMEGTKPDKIYGYKNGSAKNNLGTQYVYFSNELKNILEQDKKLPQYVKNFFSNKETIPQFSMSDFLNEFITEPRTKNSFSYKAEIPYNFSDLLHLNFPIVEQPVYKKLEKFSSEVLSKKTVDYDTVNKGIMGSYNEMNFDDYLAASVINHALYEANAVKNYTGYDLQEKLWDFFNGDKKKVSKILEMAGIPGNSYADFGLREDIEIDKNKYNYKMFKRENPPSEQDIMDAFNSRGNFNYVIWKDIEKIPFKEVREIPTGTRYSIADGIGGAERIEPWQKNPNGTFRILTGMEVPTDQEGKIKYMNAKYADVKIRDEDKLIDLDKPITKQGVNVRMMAARLGFISPENAGVVDEIKKYGKQMVDAYEEYILEMNLNLMAASNSMYKIKDQSMIPKVRDYINTISAYLQLPLDRVEKLKEDISRAIDSSDMHEFNNVINVLEENVYDPPFLKLMRDLAKVNGFEEYAESMIGATNKFGESLATIGSNTSMIYDWEGQKSAEDNGRLPKITRENHGSVLIKHVVSTLWPIHDIGIGDPKDFIRGLFRDFGINGYKSSKVEIKLDDNHNVSVVDQKDVSNNNDEPTYWIFSNDTLAVVKEYDEPFGGAGKGRASIDIKHGNKKQQVYAGEDNLYKPVADINEDLKAATPFQTYGDAVKALRGDEPTIDLGQGQFAVIQNGFGFKNPVAYFVMNDDMGKSIHRVETKNRFGEAAQFYRHPVVDHPFGMGASTRSIEILIDNKNATNGYQNPVPVGRYSLDFNPEYETEEDAAWLRRITPTAKVGATVWDRIKGVFDENWIDRFRAQFLDHHQALLRNERLAVSLKKERGEDYHTLASQGAHAKALFADRGNAILASALKDGALTFHTEEGIAKVEDFEIHGDAYEKKFGGLRDILEPLVSEEGKKKNLLQKWHAYAISLRAHRLNEQGKMSPIDKDDIAKGLEIINQHPEIKQVHDNFQRWNNMVVNFMKDTGIINDKMGEVWKKYADYVPFYRGLTDETTEGVMEIMKQELKSQEISIINSMVNRQPSKRLLGSKKGEIMDPLEAISRNVHAAITSGLRNYAATKAMEDAIYIGQAAPVGELTDEMSKDEKIAYYTDMKSPGLVSIMIEGKKKFFVVKDPLLFEAIAGFNNGHHPFFDLMAKPANLLRETITRTPNFMLANMMKDSLSAGASSGAMGTGPSWIPVAVGSTILRAGMSMAGKRTDTLARLERVGGVVGGYDLGGVDVSTHGLKALLAQQARTYKTMNPGKMLRKLWDDAGRLSHISESATRQLVFETVLRETGNEAEAAFQAMEVMNFSRRGSNPVFRAIAMMIPFLNARIQGLDVLGRAAFGHYSSSGKMTRNEIQTAFATRMGMLIGMSLLYSMLMDGDELYEGLTPEIRDNNFILPSPSINGHKNYFTFPIAFEVGVITKLWPELIYRMSTGKLSGRMGIQSFRKSLANATHFDWIPQAIKPLVEARMNYDMYKESPILDRFMTPGADAYNPSTNEAAKLIGKATGISPLKIEHIMKGYTGTVGSYALAAIDSATRTLTGAPSKPEFEYGDPRSFSKYPFFKRFLVGESNSGERQMFYDLKYLSDGVTDTLNKLELRGDRAAVARIKKDNAGILSVKKKLDRLGRRMQQLNIRKRKIEEAPNNVLSPQAKAKQIYDLEKIQKKMLEDIKKLEKQANLPLWGSRH